MSEFISVSYLDKIEQANERFRRMSLSECMEMWNSEACDHYCRFMQMREMGDLSWWDALSNELGAWQLVNVVLNSTDHFNNSDMYFFYDQFNEQDERVDSIITNDIYLS